MPVNALRHVFAELVKYLHLALLLFVLFGWLAPKPALYIHVLTIPLMICQWRFNRGTCLLTNLENWLRKKKVHDEQEQGQFIKSILIRFCNPLPSDRKIKTGLYTVIWTSFTLSCLRLFI